MKNPATDYENLLFTTVRIETSYPDNQMSSGTGFLISYDREDDLKEIFLITNKHVIDGGINWKLLFNVTDDSSSRGKPIIGEHTGADIGNARECWIKHPQYDIALLYFNQIYKILERNKRPPFIRTIGYKSIPSQDEINTKIDAIEDVLVIGYPNALYDQKSLIPIVRQGITATPFSVDFYNEPKFLIDASIFPGSSGSPVLICDRNLLYKKGGWNTDKRTFLLGIVAETYFTQESNDIIELEIPVTKKQIVQTHQMIDLGIVYKSSIIKSMIDSIISSGKYYP